MKTLFVILLLACCAALGAEYVTIQKTNAATKVYQLETNRAATLKFLSTDGVEFLIGKIDGRTVFFLDEAQFYASNYRAPSITGPATIELTGSQPAFATFEIIKFGEQPGLTTPSTAVVIPEDATGPVQIILESSTDLVTWTPTNPGTYGASTSKRFFRVRAVKQ